MSSGYVWRTRVIWALLAVVSAFYGVRLYWLQIVDHTVYAAQADHQYFARTRDVFDRGVIFFSDKSGELITAASLASGFTLAVNPKELRDAAGVYEKINAIVPIAHDEFLSKATKADDVYEEINHRVESKSADAIAKLKIPGVILSREQWRFYPGGTMASHALGFVGYQGNVLSGRYGLERYYEDVLSRTDRNPYTNVFADIFSTAKKLLNRQEIGGDLISTIEPNVQAALEHALAGIAGAWHPDIIGGVIINPQNGEVYALAADPNFDPNVYAKEKDPRVFSNPLVENVYEMGSIIKPITMSIGLDTGLITATTTYTDQGFLLLNGSRIANFDGKGRGTVTMQEVLNQSLNTGAAFVSLSVGKETFAKYLRAFGIGEETGIDLPGETHGLIGNLKSPRDLEYATAAFGQGIALTPIETVRALSALANGGKLITPHLVSAIRYDGGLVRTINPDEGVRVISKDSAEKISNMLVEVYDKALLGGKVKIKNYSIAAKTGTAQIANSGETGYYDDRYLHSFFGYFPAYDARFLVFLFAVNPKGAGFASQTLTEPFVDTAKFLINYYSVPPDR